MEGLAVLLVITAVMFTGLSAVRFHPDESHWIGASSSFEAYVTGRVLDPIWQAREDRYTMAPITSYVIGAARRLGGWTPDALNKPYDFNRPYSLNLADGRVPVPGLLAWSRRGVTATAVIGLYVSVVVFARAAGRPAACVWLVLVLASPYLRDMLRRAMNEGVLLAALALVIWATFRLLAELDRPHAQWRQWTLVGWLVLAGGAAGLAAQTKLNGAIVGFGVLAVIGVVVSAPAFLTPLDWSRYYLLPVYFLGFPTVMAADWLVRRTWQSLSAARARL
jgi:hypothetical protein